MTDLAFPLSVCWWNSFIKPWDCWNIINLRLCVFVLIHEGKFASNCAYLLPFWCNHSASEMYFSFSLNTQLRCKQSSLANKLWQSQRTLPAEQQVTESWSKWASGEETWTSSSCGPNTWLGTHILRAYWTNQVSRHNFTGIMLLWRYFCSFFCLQVVKKYLMQLEVKCLACFHLVPVLIKALTERIYVACAVTIWLQRHST